MMKNVRVLAMLLVLVLLTALVPVSLAQEETFGLSDEDFALWNEANATSASFDSLNYNFDLSLVIEGLQEDAVNVTLNGNGVIGSGDDGSPLLSLVVVGEANDGTQTQPIQFEARLIGDMVYFNTGEGWQGGTAEDLVGLLGSQLGGALPVDPEAMAQGDLSELTAMPGFMEAFSAFSQIDINEYITVERLDDMDGQAHFQLNLALGDLLAAPELAPAFGAALSGQMGGDAAEMTDQQLEQMGAMVGMLFADLSLTFDQFVDTNTNQVEQAVFELDFPLSAMMTGGEEGNINLVFDINLTYDQPVSLEVPENVEMIESGS